MTSAVPEDPIGAGDRDPASIVREAGALTLTEPAPESQNYNCPRCAISVTEPWYGPCGNCRAELRSTHGGERRELTKVEYIPKMNVTPNAVATKD